MAARSGQITVTTAGTEVSGPNEPGNLFAIRAHPDNTDTVWFGADSTNTAVASTTGMALNPTDAPIVIQIANLNQLLFDADANGSKFCWLHLD